RLCACELRLPRRPPLFPYTPLFRSTVADGACRVERGADRRVDVTLVADPEALVAAAQARAAPWVGRLARTVDWIRGRARAEDTVAAITGAASLATAIARRRIRIGRSEEH